MAGARLIVQGIERRRALMRFVKDYLKTEGYGPSIADIAKHLGITKTAVRNHVDILVSAGELEVTPGRYRSLRLPAKPAVKNGPKAL